MSADPRAALAAFVSALERHLEAASSRRSENDPTVVAAYQDLAEAFDRYDDALMEAYGEVTPLEIYSGDEDDEDGDEEDGEDFDEEEFDEDEDDSPYLGLDDEEYDEDEDADDSGDADSDDADSDDAAPEEAAPTPR